MAFQKSFTLPNGAVGNYIRLTAYFWDRTTKEASAHFSLFASSAYAASAPDQPLCLVAKLRLTAGEFDFYLSTAALAALENPGPDPVREQLYKAAKLEPLQPGGGLTRDQVSFADAVDV